MLKNFQEILRGDVEHALLHLWSDQLSEAEAMAIRNRVRKDPGYRDAFYGSLEILGSMEELAGDSRIQEIAPEFRRLTQRRRSRRSVGMGMAAGLLVAISAALVYFSPWSAPDDSRLQEYSTRIGEQRTIGLDDGSVITLNTASRLVVDYTDQVRRILLERGEAYFDVAEELEIPFTVDLGLRSVTALGTAFNIRKTLQNYQVAVIEGAVAWHEPADEVLASQPPIPVDGRAVVISSPGQHRVEAGWVAEFDLSSSRLAAFRPESMDRFKEWRTGMISFYPEPLVRVVQELNRYSRKKILIEDASVMELSVYTTVNVREIESALDGLEKLLPIKLTRHYDRIVITGLTEN